MQLSALEMYYLHLGCPISDGILLYPNIKDKLHILRKECSSDIRTAQIQQ